ncbi:MAG: glycosyltransferase family 4 protein [Patescibacteria group bacterium]
MKLLICTQIVDTTDSNLGFFHRWIEEFAQHCEQVTVVCLKRGEYNLPSNVRVLSLGKEENTSKFTRVIRFYRYIISTRHNYDAVFVHMNAEYAVLGGWLFKRWGKKVSLWYAHKSVTRMLQFAMRFIDVVFTVAPDSFKIDSEKVRAVGHGIDTELFKPDIRESSIETRLITSGRIAGSKHLLEMLTMLDVLHTRGELFTFTVVGEPTTNEEARYATELRQEIGKRPYNAKVYMRGGLLHENLPKVLNLQDLFLNFATTGNMDKAGLEALSTGVPVLTTNEAFKGLLHPFDLFVPSTHPALIADALQKFVGKSDKEKSAIAATLRNKVVADHSLTKLIPKILHHL